MVKNINLKVFSFIFSSLLLVGCGGGGGDGSASVYEPMEMNVTSANNGVLTLDFDIQNLGENKNYEFEINVPVGEYQKSVAFLMNCTSSNNYCENLNTVTCTTTPTYYTNSTQYYWLSCNSNLGSGVSIYDGATVSQNSSLVFLMRYVENINDSTYKTYSLSLDL